MILPAFLRDQTLQKFKGIYYVLKVIMEMKHGKFQSDVIYANID